jgi:hypothetical protein
LTEKQAIAIGSAIASIVHQVHTLAAAKKGVTKSHAVLQAMKSEYSWFMPMLEVIMAHKAAQPRGSVAMDRLRSMRSSISPVASSHVPLHADTSSLSADAADEESGFSSVVRLGAHGPRLALCPLASDALRPKARFCALPANCGGTPPQVPAVAEASEVVDSTLAEPIAAAAALGLAPHDPLDVGSKSEVPDFAQGWHAAMRFAVWYFADLCRSALQRAAAPEICLHMRVRRDPNTSYPLMPGWMQRNRSVLTAINTAINMMKRLLHQVLREHDRGV